MLDAMAKHAAVFEPKEVEILTVAFNLALKKCGADKEPDAEEKTELACLVHNLGRSRLKLGRALRNMTDASRLAEEAADLMGYIKQAPAVSLDGPRGKQSLDRDVTIFPTDLRAPPTSAFRKF